MSLVAYSDGASIGNPGEAGCGALLVDEAGEVLLEDYRYLGRATNNVAEYEGAILALKLASELGAARVRAPGRRVYREARLPRGKRNSRPTRS